MSTKQSRERCSGECRALWRINYTFVQDIGRSVEGTGEVRIVGTRKQAAQFDVVALTSALAQASWDRSFGQRATYPEEDRFSVHQHGEPEFVCYIDSVVSLS